ncbi:hypothetical protein [uncultured Selenomonas sp.]|uniref:hypothetical protein n=1 Tax=uncultured Selenomonas sp. TaxID=159275 RepID=UPI0025CF6703|nr:hypothetical protein [uncultured Selenomonas sp.]
MQEDSKSLRKLQEQELAGTIERDKRGQYMAFALGLSAFGLIAFSLWLGYLWFAGGIGVVALFSVVKAFLKGK